MAKEQEYVYVVIEKDMQYYNDCFAFKDENKAIRFKSESEKRENIGDRRYALNYTIEKKEV